MKLDNLVTIKSKGKAYRYFRMAGKPLIRLPDLPTDSAAFLAAYAAAKAELSPPPDAALGTIAAAITACMKSTAYLGKAASYRLTLRAHFDQIRNTAKNAKLAHLRQEHIKADLATLAPNPARHRFKTWRLFCAWAVDSGLLSTDPSAGIKQPRSAKSDGHPTWTADDIAMFRARWPIGTTPRAAMELLHWTGARISDAVNMGRGNIDPQGVLTYRQQKTRDLAHCPWTCPLPVYAQGMASDRETMHHALASLSGHMTFLATQGGRTRTVAGLGGLVSQACKDAGLHGKSAHGLRKARAVALAQAGATTHQIAAWTGHHSLAEVAHYTRASDRRAMVMGTEQDQNDAKPQRPAVKLSVK